MSDSVILQYRKILGNPIEGKPDICISHDNFFLYCIRNMIFTFDADSFEKGRVVSNDSIIDSPITSLAINPSHSLVAVGFLNNSVQIFDIKKKESAKLIQNKNNSPITNLVFINDTTIFYVNEQLLVCASYSMNLLKPLSFLAKGIIKELFTIQIAGPVHQISSPSCYLPPETRKDSALFNDLLFLSGTISIIIAKINLNLPDKKEILFTKQVANAVSTFTLPDPSNLLCVYAAPSDISVISLTVTQRECTLITDQIDKTPILVNFLTNTIFAVMYSDFSCYITSLTDTKSITQSKLPFNGLLLPGHHSFFVMQMSDTLPVADLFNLKMITFEEKIENYHEKKDFEGALNLCRRAMASEGSSIPGLPTSESQKARVIERGLSPFLKDKIEQALNQTNTDEQAKKETDYLISLSQELKMTDWVVNGAVDIFNEFGQLPAFFELILAFDPSAKFFNYTEKFVDSLLSNHGDLSITSFLLSLQSKVLPLTKFLQYGLETKNSELLAQVYLVKLNDPVKCVTIYSHTNNFTAIFAVLKEYLERPSSYEKKSALIKCIFSSTAKEKFPYLRKIIRSEEIELIDKIKTYLESFEHSNNPYGSYSSDQHLHGPPLNFEQFINTTIYACSLENIKATSKVHQLIVSYILEKIPKLTTKSIQYFFPRIFTDVYDENINSEEIQMEIKEKENLLKVILTMDFDSSILESLLPLCTTFHLFNARRKILIKLRKFDIMIKNEIIEYGKGKSTKNVYEFIQHLIKNQEGQNDIESLTVIRKAVISNSTLLIAKDVKAFVNIILTYFTTTENEVQSSPTNSYKQPIKQINHEIFAVLPDPNTQLYYLRALLADKRAIKIKLDQEIMTKYVEFACRYFPEEVTDFILNREDVNIGDFFEVCKQNLVLDACAIILHKIGEVERSFKYLNSYLNNQFYRFITTADDTDLIKIDRSSENSFNSPFAEIGFDSQILSHSFKLISAFLSKNKIENGQEYCSMIIKSFFLPLYKLSQEENGDSIKSKLLCEYLRKVCAVTTDNMDYNDILRLIIVEFAPLNLGMMRTTLCGLINDYDYDIDLSKWLTILFQQDGIHAQDIYEMKTIKGTIYHKIYCGLCNGLLSKSDNVKIFPCGHSFHEPCLNEKQICPICNPMERIDQEEYRPTTEIKPRIVFIRLNRFERGLQRKQNSNEKQFQDKGQIFLARDT